MESRDENYVAIYTQDGLIGATIISIARDLKDDLNRHGIKIIKEEPVSYEEAKEIRSKIQGFPEYRDN